jgi:propionyl-CoA carboxylase beta chain
MERLGAGTPRRASPTSCESARLSGGHSRAVCVHSADNIDRPRAKGTDPRDRRDAALLDVVPDHPNKPYDMHDVITRVVDDGRFYEVQREYAQNILCGFAHLGGTSIGIVANQPAVLAGVLDISASLKAARFIRFCDAFNIRRDLRGRTRLPPGTAQEHGGIIKHGAVSRVL